MSISQSISFNGHGVIRLCKAQITIFILLFLHIYLTNCNISHVKVLFSYIWQSHWNQEQNKKFQSKDATNLMNYHEWNELLVYQHMHMTLHPLVKISWKVQNLSVESGICNLVIKLNNVWLFPSINRTLILRKWPSFISRSQFKIFDFITTIITKEYESNHQKIDFT